MRTIAWVVHNLNHFRIEANSTLQAVQTSKIIAREGLFTLDDSVKSDSLWILERLVFSEDEKTIGLVASPEILHHIAEAIGSGVEYLYTPAVKAIAVILTTNDHKIIERALWAGSLTKFSELIVGILQGFLKGKKLLREILWAISNVTAASSFCVDKFADTKLLELTCDIILDSNLAIDARKEGLWVLCNAITLADSEVKYKLVSQAPTLLSCLVFGCRPTQDQRLLMNILESINDILHLDNTIPSLRKTEDSMAYNWERSGGLDVLEEV